MSELRRHAALNLYEVLEVSPRASQDVIHAAYRVLARNSHPDHNAASEAGQRIRQLNAAFEVLSNPEQRARYDFNCMRARRTTPVTPIEPTVPMRTSSARRPGRLAVTPAPGRRAAAAPLLFAIGMVILLATAILLMVWIDADAVPNDVGVRAGPTVDLSTP